MNEKEELPCAGLQLPPTVCLMATVAPLFRTVILYIFIIQQSVLYDKEYSQSANEGNCGSIYWNYKNTDIIGHFKECYLWTRTLFSWFFLGLFKLLLKKLLKKHGICLIRWAMYLSVKANAQTRQK